MLKLLIILIFCNSILCKNDGGVIEKTLENQNVISFIRTIDKGSNISLKITPIKEKCKEPIFHYYIRWIALHSTCMKSFSSWEEFNWLRDSTAGNLNAYFDDITCVSSNYDINYPGMLSGSEIQCGEERIIDLTENAHWSDMYRLSSHNANSEVYDDVCLDEPQNQSSVPLDGTYMFAIFVKKMEEFTPGTSGFAVTMQIKTTTGYLDLIEYPLLRFYGAMCILYVLFSLVWSVIASKRFEYLGLYQNLITVLLLLSTIESTLFYSNYLAYNTTGESIMFMPQFGTILNGIKHAVLCATLIIIGIGYGVTKQRQTSVLGRVFIVSLLYFVLCMVQAFIKSGTQFEVLRKSNNAYFFSWIPMLTVQVIIAFWVFLGLSGTIKTVKERNDVTKLRTYQYFKAAIIVFYILSLIINVGNWLMINMQCVPYSVPWKVQAFLEILYFTIFLVLAILWYPNDASNDMYYKSDFDKQVEKEGSATLNLVNSEDEI